MTKLDKIVAKIDKLPDMFTVAVQVLKALENPDCDVNELSALISKDPSLTSKLLKLCNSAQFGFSRKIATIKDAIPKLGFKTLKSIIFVALSKNVLNKEIKGYGLGKSDLWHNSISCAVYSRKLAEMSNYRDPELAFTAGLLRDIGKLVIHEYIGESYDEILETVMSDNITFIDAEEKVLGFNHCDIGAKIALKWNFPDVLIETIQFHHSSKNYKAVQDPKLLSIVHIADAITMLLGVGLGNDGMMYKVDMKAVETLGIKASASSIDELIAEMVELNDEIQRMIGPNDEQ